MRILIADDHALFRDGLRSLLAANDLEVVGEASNGEEAVELSWQLKPDVVLMDLGMPEVDGIEATKQLAAELPEIKVVVLTASEDEDHLFEAIKSGAKGYLLKDLQSEQFSQPARGRRARRARSDSDPGAQAARRVRAPQARDAERFDPDALTQREQEVLELMVTGVTSNRRLAQGARGQREHRQVPRPQHPRQAPPAQSRPGGRLRSAQSARRARSRELVRAVHFDKAERAVMSYSSTVG